MEVDVSRQDVAEKLSLWVDTFDALELRAAQQSIKTLADAKPSDLQPAKTDAVEAEFHRVRTAMVQAITANDTSRNTPPPDAATETVADYAPYRQRYIEQQRHMESKIGPLRAHVRQALSRASPKLRQLAYLDAVMDQMILGGREQKLLTTVPVLLERRFEHLRKTHSQAGWLDVFRKELQEVLLAEMNVRLQPVVGLMEAFSNEVKKSQ